MDWTEILIEIDAKDVDTASDIAGMAVPYGFYIEDYSDLEQGAKEIAHIDLIDEELLYGNLPVDPEACRLKDGRKHHHSR